MIFKAGKVFGDANESMANCLREYKVDDKVTALQHDAKIWREDEFKPAKELPPFLNKAYLGTDQVVISEIGRVFAKYKQIYLLHVVTQQC